MYSKKKVLFYYLKMLMASVCLQTPFNSHLFNIMPQSRPSQEKLCYINYKDIELWLQGFRSFEVVRDILDFHWAIDNFKKLLPIQKAENRHRNEDGISRAQGMCVTDVCCQWLLFLLSLFEGKSIEADGPGSCFLKHSTKINQYLLLYYPCQLSMY